MRNILLAVVIFLLLLTTACEKRKKITQIETVIGQTDLILEYPENKSIPMPDVGLPTYISGTIYGNTPSQYNMLHPAGPWGSENIVEINVSSGNNQTIKCWFGRNGRLYRFYPRLITRTTTSEGVTYAELKHVSINSAPFSDSTGYSAQMYYDMATRVSLSFNQYGLVVNPLSNSDPFIIAKATYSGIADTTLTWPDSVNVASYNELGHSIASTDSVFVVLTYNGLDSDYRVPMQHPILTDPWEFEFPYLPNGGLNIRFEKSNEEVLFMGGRLSTSLGSVSLSNVHFFPDSLGNNTWALLQANIENGVPTIPYPGINQLVNIFELIIGGKGYYNKEEANPWKNVPIIQNKKFSL